MFGRFNEPQDQLPKLTVSRCAKSLISQRNAEVISSEHLLVYLRIDDTASYSTKLDPRHKDVDFCVETRLIHPKVIKMAAKATPIQTLVLFCRIRTCLGLTHRLCFMNASCRICSTTFCSVIGRLLTHRYVKRPNVLTVTS